MLYAKPFAASGNVVVKELCYKPKVAGSRPNEEFFLIYLILPAALGLGIEAILVRTDLLIRVDRKCSGIYCKTGTIELKICC
jgi:hypothetical protein